MITQGKYISKRVTTRTQCSVEAWCLEVLGRWPLGFFRVGVVCIAWNNDNNRKSVSKRVTKIKTKSKCVPTIKNNSKGDITFKECNIFVEVVLRTAEHRVIMKNRLPQSETATSFRQSSNSWAQRVREVQVRVNKRVLLNK